MSEFIVSCDTAALVQKSVISQPGFYGDPSLKDSTASFGQAVGICTSLAGAAASLMNSKAPSNYKRTPTGPYYLTQAEKDAIDRKASELSLVGVVPYDTLKTFFGILASLQNITELAYVADVVGIPEMNNVTLIRNIRGILDLRDIYKVGYLANGVASVIQAFSGNFSGAQSAGSQGAANIMGAINKIAKIAGAAAAVGQLAEQVGGLAIGNYMSELLTGERLKTQQIARNPSLTPPSYQGKAFFGEAGVGIPAVDEMFCRRVGAFSQESGSNGSVSFGFQNFASFAGGMSMGSLITKMTLGTSVIPPAATAIGLQVTNMISNVSSVLNVATNAVVELRRSDNAIPFMIGLASGIAGQTQCPFNSSVFTEGWKVASSVGNDLQRYNPQYLATCRTSL